MTTLTTTFDVRRGGSLAVVATLAALVLGACGTTTGTDTADDDGPAAATLSGSETAPTSSPEPTAPEIAPAPSGDETPVGGQPWDEAATAACAAEVADGFTQVAQTGDDDGVTTFWTSGRRWVTCDVAGDDPVLITSARGRPGFDERSLGLSTALVGAADDPAVRFVAGGLLPWPVDEISYTFPDGHVEQARFVTSEDAEHTWWAVTYTATDGPLADPATDAADLPPATISIVGAAAEAFRLPWEDLQRSE